MRFETPPGHPGQVDFADFRLPCGKRYAFLVVLGFSRILWLQFFSLQTMQHVSEGLEAAFTFFGGVPRELLFDQMKAVIIKDERDPGGRISENTEFLRLAHHNDRWAFQRAALEQRALVGHSSNTGKSPGGRPQPQSRTVSMAAVVLLR
ncbi:MAG: hypothetical protein V3T74_13785 [Gemmatimonadales bacterium]